MRISAGSSDVCSSDLAYRALASYVRAVTISAAPHKQVVLAEGSTPAAPRFDDCGDKPLAAVFDADETLIWNLGAMRYMAERHTGFDPAVWNQWAKQIGRPSCRERECKSV